MDFFALSGPAIGLAYNPYVDQLVEDEPDCVDFVEMPFELLRHNSAAAAISRHKPCILHSASLSLAGGAVTAETWKSVGDWIGRTASPWLGEHLAFVNAPLEGDPEEQFDVGYSVNPCMNGEVIAHVVAAVAACEAVYSIPVLLENSPVYFSLPGSTMNQIEFISEICRRSSAGLLLDLAHLYISAKNASCDPLEMLQDLPLERVIEVHVSGAGVVGDTHWDDHTVRAPAAVHEMLALVLKKAPLRAITLEYNWSINFPRDVLLDEIKRTRSLVSTLC